MFKVLAITLIAAIANPFCCCNTSYASGVASVAQEGVGQHACCGLADSPIEQRAGDQEQGTNDCSHQAERENQLHQVTSSSHFLLKFATFVAEFPTNPGYGLNEGGYVREQRLHLKVDSLPPPTTYLRLYCVNLS